MAIKSYHEPAVAWPLVPGKCIRLDAWEAAWPAPCRTRVACCWVATPAGHSARSRLLVEWFMSSKYHHSTWVLAWAKASLYISFRSFCRQTLPVEPCISRQVFTRSMSHPHFAFFTERQKGLRYFKYLGIALSSVV